MIERYTRPRMGHLWSDEAKFQTWLDVEIAVCEAMAELGQIPEAALLEIKQKAKFDVARIKQIEEEVKHDVIAFITNVSENIGDSARYVHVGLTSSDVVDTALALQLKQAGEILQEELAQLHDAILELAVRHRHTAMIGRSHGIHAEPMTFGYKMLGWLEEVKRHQVRLDSAIEQMSVGQMSGAVGTYSNIDPEVERLACKYLRLRPEPISTQVVPRDRHAHFMFVLGLIASGLERFAIEIRHLQRTDVLEVEEPFSHGQKGSSAMPHKRNPVGCENITGLARVVRSNVIAAMENIPLWHERDISHSSVDRIILPDSTILLDYMLARFTRIVKSLVVYPENMRRNMDKYGGVIFSQAVLLKLVEKGLARTDAYAIVQDIAMKAWNTETGNFAEGLFADSRVKAVLTEQEVQDCLNADTYLRNLDSVYARLGVKL